MRFIVLLSLVSAFILVNVPNVLAQKKKTKTVKASPCRGLKQGITGTVIFKSGNYMPSVDNQNSPATNLGVTREIFVYQLTNQSQVQQDPEDMTFFTNPKTKLVAKTKSKKNGCFTIRLAEGKYSVFVKEKGKFYANSFDGEGNIFPVSVKEGNATNIVFEINCGAVY
jgi:hypothetical protein